MLPWEQSREKKGEGYGGIGTQGLFFLKKARKEIQTTKKRNCRICRQGTEGANSEAWKVHLTQAPAPALPPGSQHRRENKEQKRPSSIGVHRAAAGGEQVNACPRWRQPDTTFPLQPPTHLHDKPQNLCSSQGACSWGNPEQTNKQKTNKLKASPREEWHLSLLVFNPPTQLGPLQALRSSKEGGMGEGALLPSLQTASVYMQNVGCRS